MRKVLSIFITLCILISGVLNVFAAGDTLESILDGQAPTIEVVKAKLDRLVTYTTKKFSDVKSSHWYVKSLSKLVGMQGIDGYKDGTFRPQTQIKVAEFTKLLLAAAGYKEELAKGQWYANYVTRAKELGVIEEGDNYNYNSGMKRKDMAKMICKLLKIEPSTSGTSVFSDAQNIDSKWIDAAFNEYLIRGYGKEGARTFKPMQTATRAEVSEMVIRALEYRENPEEFKRANGGGEAPSTSTSYTEVKGYKIPNNLTVNVKTDFEIAEIMISIDLKKGLDIQNKETESILKSKFSSTDINPVIDYVKQYSDASTVLPKRDFTIAGRVVSVGGQAGVATITVFAN
ncbi:S-layer homology domain-containing protein [Pseudobacteroides cellulosolvens]|uniref:S-layer domain-containing protein n=1 Tax=Pseudobacteroides cellulosolvens ATCC 35603 = DSM 2933 TaxID=398512 RepID=A0A0L6JHW6_9FIRM|nr:S-layer homology domain-containing protein [Pseudobacteroides cellulosolvens]KNY25077.1 S-layer domain-containing protein [Pseudobacteroides cellulosolvens ATCC 35603 = DSM 2933]